MIPTPTRTKGLCKPFYTHVTGPVSDTPSTTASSTIWSGVVDLAAVQYTQVSAAWTVPTVTGSTVSHISIWVGMDGSGFNSGSTVEQVGIYGTNNGSTTLWYPWIEYYPAFEEWWSTTTYPVLAGDSMSASVVYAAGTGVFSGSNYFTLALTNTTRSWTFSARKTEQAAEFEASQTTTFPRNSAQVIVESNGGSLCDYGTVNFTNITAAPDNFGTATYLTMHNNTTSHDLSTPGQSSGAPTGGNLTMTWHNYN